MAISLPIRILLSIIFLACFMCINKSRGSLRGKEQLKDDIGKFELAKSRYTKSLSHNEFVSRILSADADNFAEMQRALVMGQNALRVAVFGSSNAWGAALQSRFEAYPFLVSPEVVNYASFSEGPNYPAVCASTIVGDEQDFDVIIFDFWLKAQQGLEGLALRLRQRFPHATMIFNKIWSISDFRRKPSHLSAEEQTLNQWLDSMGLAQEGYRKVKAALMADDGYWYFPEYTLAEASIQTAMESVGGVQFHFPFRNTTKQTIIDFLGYFDEQTHRYLSERGHAQVALCMQEIIDSQPHELVISRDAGLSWAASDSCHLWFATGGCPFQFSQNWSMIRYDPTQGKYALHINDAGWIDMQNDFPDNRTLFVSFLATNDNSYPTTLIEFQDADGNQVSTSLEPYTTLDNQHVHITRTVSVGKIPHGTTRITIQPNVSSSLPFRLVGFSLTDEERIPLEYGFGPQFNE